MSKQHDFALPAVEIGAQRLTTVLLNRQRAQRAFNLVVGTVVVLVAYTLGKASLVLVVLILLSGVALGSAITRLRAFGESYRGVQEIAPMMVPGEAQAMRRASREQGRVVVRSIVLAVVLVIPTIAWAAYGRARGFVAAICILILAYLRSSIKILAPRTPEFADLAEAAREQGCRIALFRSFEEGPSRLTRSVLIPVLSGYGRLDVVFDQTLADAEDKGFLGEDVKLERFATLHRFDNAEWQDRVAELIEQTDIAVVEATRLTPGVAWELANCFKHLPPWRVYPVINLEVLEESMKEYLTAFYKRAGPELGMPRDIRPRFFVLGEGANQGETIALDVHAKMVGIGAIESGVQDPSAFGPGAARSLGNRADDVPTGIDHT